MQKRSARIAVLSAAVPPDGSGQATVLNHLLLGNDRHHIILLSDFSHLGPSGQKSDTISALDVRQLSGIELVTPADFNFPSGSINQAILFDLCRRAGEISECIRADKVAAIIGCTGTPIDIPAAALAAEDLNLPLIAYLFDDPIYQWPAGPHRNFAEWQEFSWSRRAKAIIAPNEFMAKEFHRRTGRIPEIIRNPVDLTVYMNTVIAPVRNHIAKRIVYTGSIYHAQLDAFKNLIVAIGADPSYEIHVYTNQDKAIWRENGVDGDVVVHHPYIEYQCIPYVQKNADILFLPLAFDSGIEEVLRTSAPAKLGEYLAAGRPILVHAPLDSFVADHIQSNNAGMVVGEPDPTALKAALDRISTTPELSGLLARNAVKLSYHYDLTRVRGQFWSVIERASSGVLVRWKRRVDDHCRKGGS
jgi:hypothetical protein